mgnify:CR=1 FL=1
MWNRKNLKTQGKAAMKRNYWKSVLVGIVDALLLSGATAAARTNGNVSDAQTQISTEGFSPAAVIALFTALIGLAVIVLLGSLVANALLVGPLRVGSAHFKLSALQGVGNISELGSGFDANYTNNVKAMFLSSLYIELWSILLIVPGIIKSYEYRMVPYILAEKPDLSAKEVLARSKAMMDGNKWDTFVLDLSFLLWDVLNGITFGLSGLFYSNPYKSMTDAALYEAVKNG